jgi:hypothetical protein
VGLHEHCHGLALSYDLIFARRQVLNGGVWDVVIKPYDAVALVAMPSC